MVGREVELSLRYNEGGGNDHIYIGDDTGVKVGPKVPFLVDKLWFVNGSSLARNFSELFSERCLSGMKTTLVA